MVIREKQFCALYSGCFAFCTIQSDVIRLFRLSSQCVRKSPSPADAQNNIKNLGIMRYYPEIEDVIRPVGVNPLDLPTDDQITHAVADIVLAVNDEHYTVLYLGTGTCAHLCVKMLRVATCVKFCLESFHLLKKIHVYTTKFQNLTVLTHFIPVLSGKLLVLNPVF